MTKVTALNGKDYFSVKQTKEYGEILLSNGRYYFYSRRVHRMMPLKKSIALELEAM